MNKNKLIKIISVIIVLVLSAYYIYINFVDFLEVEISNFHLIIFIVFIYLLYVFNTGLILKYLLKPYKINLSFKQYFGLSAISLFYNLILPFRGGAVVRAVYLKKKFSFNYSKFLSTMYGTYLASFFTTGFVGTMFLIFIKITENYFNVFLFLFFLCFTAIMAFFMFVNHKYYSGVFKWIKPVNKVLLGWEEIQKDRFSILIVIVFSTINLFLFGLIFSLEFLMLSEYISYYKLVFLACISNLSLFLSITPGSLGVKEVLTSFVGVVLLLPEIKVVSVLILDRIFTSLIVIVVGLFFSKLLISKKK
ncbi:MAG: lysylphosphatidylglycerol synthase transmembrane domain-containing protein [Nanoarchaeota archaeon]